MTQAPSTNFFLDNDDLRFQIERLDWKTLLELQELGDTSGEGFKSPAEALTFFNEVLSTVGALAAKEIAPFERELDAQHPVLKDGDVVHPPRLQTIMNKLHDLGALGFTLPRRLGGSNAPLLLANLFVELIVRADASVVGQFAFHHGIAQALHFYALDEGSFEVKDGAITKTRFDDVIERIINDAEWGAMVLTEPHAGSDLAQLRSKAVLHADGTWRLTGQKIYITAGHGDHHIVIARSEDEATHPGLAGLSLFYVPRFVTKDGVRCKKDAPGAQRNFEIGGVENKMGQHSCVAATIHYEDSRAELIGKRGAGFVGMLMLMNNARIAVSFEALGTCEAAYRLARGYAEERKTMGKPIAHHEMIADYLDEMDVVIRALRAITFDAAFHEELAARMGVKRVLDKDAPHAERRELEKKMNVHKARARKLTPLIKYYGGEECVRQARMAMQIMGGIGYIQETGAEKILRDALVMPVYEGTSQIQSLMALKDTLSRSLKNPRQFVSDLASARLLSLSGNDAMEKGAALLQWHALSAQQMIMTRIAAAKLADKIVDVRRRPFGEWRTALLKGFDPSSDFSFGMLHAERLTKLLTWAEMAEVLVRQATEAAGTPHAEERAAIALRFVERFEPRARGVLLEIEGTGGSLLSHLVGRKKAPLAAAAE